MLPLRPDLSQSVVLPARGPGCLFPRQSRVLPCRPRGESGRGWTESCPPQLCFSGRLNHLHCSPWSMGLRLHSAACHFPYSHWSSLVKTISNKNRKSLSKLGIYLWPIIMDYHSSSQIHKYFPLTHSTPCTPVTLIMLKDFTPSSPVLDNLPCPRQVLSNEDAENQDCVRAPECSGWSEWSYMTQWFLGCDLILYGWGNMAELDGSGALRDSFMDTIFELGLEYVQEIRRPPWRWSAFLVIQRHGSGGKITKQTQKEN